MARNPTPTTTDLSAFGALLMRDTSRLELELPTGAPMLYKGQRVAVVLYGPSTDQFARAKAEQQRQALARTLQAAGNKKVKVSTDDEEADAAFLTAITADFENFPFPGGAAAVYRERALRYVNTQVFAHVNDLGNFLPDGETS